MRCVIALALTLAMLALAPGAAALGDDAQAATHAGTHTYRDDDGTRETSVTLDYVDDRMEKTLHLGPHDGRWFDSATLWVYAASNRCAGDVPTILLVANGLPFEYVNPCEHWPEGEFAWRAFDVPPEFMTPGGENDFGFDKPSGDWRSLNLILGIDSDTDVGRSTIEANRVDVPGELMVYLVTEETADPVESGARVGTVPGGSPSVGDDADGDDVPSDVAVGQCDLVVGGPYLARCYATEKRVVALDPDDTDASRPVNREASASGWLRVGCENAEDTVCGHVDIEGPTGDSLGTDVKDNLRLDLLWQDVETFTGTRPVRTGPDGLTLTRPTSADVVTPEIDADAGGTHVHVGSTGGRYADDSPAFLTGPSASVEGVTTAEADAGDVREPTPSPGLRRAIPTLLPGETTHPLPVVEF